VRVGDLSIRVPDIGFRMAERRQTKMMPIAGRLERGRLMVRVGRPGTRQQVVAALLEEVRQRPEEWVAWGKEGAVEGGDGGGAGRM
jgi:hypothetical protein